MHLEHFSKDLMSDHVWRQTQTQSTIINFYEEDMNIFNPRQNERGNTEGILRMEFPLMQWLVACSYKIFGNHLIITRLFMFVIGLFSILGINRLLFSIFSSEELAIIGAWAFTFSPSFYYFTINPIPDNLALCSSIWGITLFFRWLGNDKKVYLLISGFLLSLGTLCKLPFIVYYIVPLSYFIIRFLNHSINKKAIVEVTCVFIFVLFPSAWYLIVIPQWNGNVIIKGILNNHESLKTILFYLQHNLVIILPDLLLNYGSVIFFLSGFYFLLHRKAYKDSKFSLVLAWSIAVLFYYLFEVNTIGTGHDYYLFPFYPLLFILVAYGAYNLMNFKIRSVRYLTLFLLLLLPFTCYLRMQIRWNPESPGFNKDLLTYKAELQGAVPKNSLVIAGNDNSHFIYFYYIDKKGWAYDHDYLTAEMLRTMIEDGAEYLYSDSRNIENNAEIMNLLDGLVFEKGTIRIFRLKKFSQ
jgi:4-amino-4-deoxy-L-arabinose transferase-like glycosyltransferase